MVAHTRIIFPDDFAKHFGAAAREEEFARHPRRRLFLLAARSPEAMQALAAAIAFRWQERNLPLPEWGSFAEFVEWLRDHWWEIAKILLLLAPLFFRDEKG